MIDKDYSFFSPSYSPDGKKILYIKQNGSLGSNYTNEIWVMDSNGTNYCRLTMGFIDSDPIWSPSGKEIIFSRRKYGEQYSLGIFMININGSELQKILSEV